MADHFNIYIAKDSDQWYTTAYERDAIQARMHWASSGDLLLATAQNPAMLVYLDNWRGERGAWTLDCRMG